LNDISTDLIDQIEALMPFGCGNHEPLFMCKNVSVTFSKIVGRRHRQLRLQQSFANRANIFQGIQFNVDPSSGPPEHFDQMAFRLRWNRWNREKTAQIVVEET
jgi:single-stranded-DNA-specific exonuclease